VEPKERYLRAAFDGAADAVIGTASDGTVCLWNRGAERLLGYAAEEMLGRSADLLIPSERVTQGEPERLRDLTSHSGRLRDYETERVTKKGDRVQVLLTRIAVPDKANPPGGAIELLHDVSERRRLEHELARAESLAGLGELAAGLAHEIRNPLAGIRSAFQIIADGLAPNDRRRAVMDEIRRQIDRMDRTLTDLLSFARPRALERRPCQVNVLLLETIGLMRGDPQMSDVEMTGDLDPTLPDVMLDPQQMQKVFFNIILNAGQAMPDGGRLAISSRRDNDRVFIAFEDKGVGMAPDVREQAFRPFFTTKTRGTGVGLSISQRIVEAHDGRLTCDSRPGEGTTLTIELPVAGAEK